MWIVVRGCVAICENLFAEDIRSELAWRVARERKNWGGDGEDWRGVVRL